MPSFKRTFSSLWYGRHLVDLGRFLFLLLFGMFFLFGAAYYASRDRLPDRPRSVDLGEAHAIVAEGRPCYVRLSAGPDDSRRMYRTGVWGPFWGNCPPGEVRTIHADDMGEKSLARMLGCAVQLEGRVDPSEIRTVGYQFPQSDSNEMAVSLGPVMGTRKRIWVRSGVIRSARPDVSGWWEGKTFAGILARYDQALATLPDGLAQKARRSLPSLPGAFVIFPDEPYKGEAKEYFTEHFWVPIRGSDSLFWWTTEEELAGGGEGITGVIEPLRPEDYLARERCFAHFESVTGRPLPERFGVIRYPTARAYNDKLSGYSGIFTIFGMLWTICGLIGLVLFIKAPDIIYGAWKGAFVKVGLLRPRRGAAGEACAAAPSKPAEPAPVLHHPLEAPFSSLPLIEEEPKPRPSMEAAFRELRSFEPSRGKRYCAFIQDFSHPNNPDAGLRLIACCEDPDEALDALLNSGQRHPGLAIELMAVHPGPFAGAKQGPSEALEAFEMLAGDLMILCHAPSPRLFQRAVICCVFEGAGPEAGARADAALEGQAGFSLMGRAVTIGDSENGPCQAMRKTAGSSLLRAGVKKRRAD